MFSNQRASSGRINGVGGLKNRIVYFDGSIDVIVKPGSEGCVFV